MLVDLRVTIRFYDVRSCSYSFPIALRLSCIMPFCDELSTPLPGLAGELPRLTALMLLRLAF